MIRIQEEREIISSCEDEILDIIDNRDEFSRGDLQGCVEAQIRKLVKKIKENNEPTPKTIKIEIRGGVVVDVNNLPDNYSYEIIDRD